MYKEQRLSQLRKKILLFLITRKMLKITTDEKLLFESIPCDPLELKESLKQLAGENMIEKISWEKVSYIELTEKGIELESVHLASLLGKLLVWCK